MEDNNGKEKKAIYKKWWFWIIVVIVLIVIIGSQGGTTNNVTTGGNTTSKSNTTTVNKVEVKVIDFSTMDKTAIEEWCTTNKIKCNFTEDYSDTVEKGGFISQSAEPDSTIYQGDKVTITYSLGKEPTIGEKNALSAAKNYLKYMSFSYSGLIKQLEFEGYSNSEATYGVDNCGADWNEQAAKKAKEYINTMSFSRSGLIKQLEYEGFTSEQAEYGVTAIGY